MDIITEIQIEGQSIKDLGIDGYLTDVTITHRLPKGKGSPAHEGNLTFVNPEQILSGYFRQLDKVTIWLGTPAQLFYQGEFKIYTIKHSGNDSSQPTMDIDLVCKSFSGVRKNRSKVWFKKKLSEFFEEQAKSEGHKFKTDLIDEVMDIAQPAHVSDYGIMSQVAEGVSRHIFLVYPERVGTQQSAIPTLNVVKEEFSEILDPSSKLPIELLYGVGDPSSSYFIRTYSVSIDVKRPSLVLGGSVSAKGETDSSNKDVMTGPEGQQIGRQDDPVKTAEEVRSGENGPKVPVRSGVGSATSPALMKELVNAAVEKANKVLLNVELVQPVPYFFQGFKVRVKGIKEFDGTYTIGEVSQKMTGTTMWTTSLDLLSKTGGPKVDKSAGKGKGQTPVESDDLEGPEGEVVGRQPAPVRKVTAK
ncbi:MAG: hypothetical protein UY48_C0012G0008 [Candidatus Gottesmanbacteria bacterium GW2011_GWB1_49_7]|uniref:Uncharacterized protein n=1 Tax=Candidatus Gottesmanbacteria bacterium GW2011_GWB1_49_7 TaxID=1618448 RepID=A0A0G1W143_9BACT|nr:MAG: hypothetical protein UY48_C0012G0008 [Candidatus Gottesmanbacteria bacterium GW2011_GWB1_49_7]